MLKKIIANCLMVCLLCGSFVLLDSSKIYVNAATKSKVYIGHAARDERGQYKGGEAGDQTGKEVFRTRWSYDSSTSGSRNWRYVFRAKDPKVADKMAKAMLQACSNNNIGYDQLNPDKYSCFKEAQKVGFNLSKITTKCEAHCASLMSVCINAAGVNVTMKLGTPNMYQELTSSGAFDVLTGEYLTNDTKLLPGDVLLSGKHTAMVVDTPYGTAYSVRDTNNNNAANTVTKTVKAVTNVVKFKKGKTYKLVYDVNIRKGAGTKYKIVKRKNLSKKARKHTLKTPTYAILKAGTKVKCKKLKNGWMKTQYGWICTGDSKEFYLK